MKTSSKKTMHQHMNLLCIKKKTNLDQVSDWNHLYPMHSRISTIIDFKLKVLFRPEIRTTGGDSYPAEPDGSHPSGSLHGKNSRRHTRNSHAGMEK